MKVGIDGRSHRVRRSGGASGARSTRRPGDRVGRYEIVSHIASGGMGEVYLARSVSVGGFERLVAVKVCHPHLADDAEFVTMFLDEARIAAAIHHPHVVATLDVADDDDLYMVMDYVEGATLSRLVKEQPGSTPIPLLVRVMIDALRGLHAAHEVCDRDGKLQNVIHRDVTPQNILVGLDGSSRLTDFGVAKAEARATITREGSVKGKLGYLAPEQLRGMEIDRRVDIFAAGVVLWEALTGCRAFRGTTDADTVAMVLTAPIHPPSTVRPEVSAALDEVVLRALARDRDKRFATADALACALEQAVAPAAQGAVGAWVRATAGDEIRARRVPREHDTDATDVSRLDEISRVEPIDSTLTSEPPPSSPPPPSPPKPVTDAARDEGTSLATLEPEQSRGQGRALLVSVIGGAVLLGGLAAYLAGGSGAPAHEHPGIAHPPPGVDVAREAASPLPEAEQAEAEQEEAEQDEAEQEGRAAGEAQAPAQEPAARADLPTPRRRGRTEPRPAPRAAPEEQRERPTSRPEEPRTGSTRFEPLAP